MSSSDSLLKQLAEAPHEKRDPGFSAVVAFEFYDGPEQGLALFPSGAGVRFVSLGDSRSRVYRAFELMAIDGHWWPQFNAVEEVEVRDRPHLLLLPSQESEPLSRLKKAVFEAAAIGTYVGVGSPYLTSLYVAAATPEELAELRQLDFEAVHRFTKRR